MLAKVRSSSGVASFLYEVATNFAGEAGSAIDIKMGDEAAHWAVASAIIARGGPFFLYRELEDFYNIVV